MPAPIFTRYHPPTDRRAPRVRATWHDRSAWTEYSPTRGDFENHREAARALAALVGLSGTWAAADVGKGYAFTRVSEGLCVTFEGSA
jgi:hypothetical protein